MGCLGHPQERAVEIIKIENHGWEPHGELLGGVKTVQARELFREIVDLTFRFPVFTFRFSTFLGLDCTHVVQAIAGGPSFDVTRPP